MKSVVTNTGTWNKENKYGNIDKTQKQAQQKFKLLYKNQVRKGYKVNIACNVKMKGQE